MSLPDQHNKPHQTKSIAATQGGYGVRINAVSVVNLVMAVGLAVEFVIHVATSFLATPTPTPTAPGVISPSTGGSSSSSSSRWWCCWLPRSDPGKEARAKAALSSMGASVFSVRTLDRWCRPPIVGSRTLSGPSTCLRLKATLSHTHTPTPTHTGPLTNARQGITLTKLVGIAVLAVAPSHLFRVYYFRLYLALILLGAFVGLAALPVLLSFWGPAPATMPRRQKQQHVHTYGEEDADGASRNRSSKHGAGAAAGAAAAAASGAAATAVRRRQRRRKAKGKGKGLEEGANPGKGATNPNLG